MTPDSTGRLAAAVDAVRRPEYTGQNRCWPCTALNAALLAVGCLLAWLVWPLLAVVAAIGGAAAIALRGYLFPYTPEVGPKLAAALPGDWFEKPARRPSGSLAGADSDEERAERLMVELERAGVLVADGQELYISDEFWAAWEAAMDDLADASTETLADAVRVAAESAGRSVEVEALSGDQQDFVVVDHPGDAGESWLSRHLAVAEVGAVRALGDVAPGLDPQLRSFAARPLRAFLPACPICGSEVIVTEPHACCGSVRDPRDLPDEVVACPECDRQLYYFDSS